MGYKNDQWYNLNNEELTGENIPVGDNNDAGFYLTGASTNEKFAFPDRIVRSISGNTATPLNSSNETILKRGYIRNIPMGDNAPTAPIRCQFQFNPAAIRQSISQSEGVLNFIQQPLSQLAQPGFGPTSFSFQLLFDRSYEMNNPAPTTDIDETDKDLWAKLPPEVGGVLHDLSRLYSIIGVGLSQELLNYAVGVYEKQSYAQYNADDEAEVPTEGWESFATDLKERAELNVGNSAFLMSLPVRIVFSSLYILEGFVTSVEVNFTKFNPAMVPMQCSVTMAVQVMYAGYARKDTMFQEALQKLSEEEPLEKEPEVDTSENVAGISPAAKLQLSKVVLKLFQDNPNETYSISDTGYPFRNTVSSYGWMFSPSEWDSQEEAWKDIWDYIKDLGFIKDPFDALFGDNDDAWENVNKYYTWTNSLRLFVFWPLVQTGQFNTPVTSAGTLVDEFNKGASIKIKRAHVKVYRYIPDGIPVSLRADLNGPGPNGESVNPALIDYLRDNATASLLSFTDDFLPVLGEVAHPPFDIGSADEYQNDKVICETAKVGLLREVLIASGTDDRTGLPWVTDGVYEATGITGAAKFFEDGAIFSDAHFGIQDWYVVDRQAIVGTDGEDDNITYGIPPIFSPYSYGSTEGRPLKFDDTDWIWPHYDREVPFPDKAFIGDPNGKSASPTKRYGIRYLIDYYIDVELTDANGVTEGHSVHSAEVINSDIAFNVALFSKELTIPWNLETTPTGPPPPGTPGVVPPDNQNIPV